MEQRLWMEMILCSLVGIFELSRKSLGNVPVRFIPDLWSRLDARAKDSNLCESSGFRMALMVMTG